MARAPEVSCWIERLAAVFGSRALKGETGDDVVVGAVAVEERHGACGEKPGWIWF